MHNLLVLLLSVLAGFVISLFARVATDEKMAVLRTVINHRSGDFTPSGGVKPAEGTFTHDGMATRVIFATQDDVGFTDVEITINSQLPTLTLKNQTIFNSLVGQDIQFDDMAFDSKFIIQGETNDAQSLLTPQIRRHILALRKRTKERPLDILVVPSNSSGTTIQIQRQGWIDSIEVLNTYIDDCHALAAMLQASNRHGWQTIADALGLELTESRGWMTLRGSYDGIPIEASLRMKGGRWVTRIQASVPCPRGLRIVHKDHGRGKSLSMDNPVLNMMVHITSQDADATRALLSDASLTEELLEVVHGIPGAMVNENGVRIDLPGRVNDNLPEMIRKAVLLASSLKQRQERGQAHQRPIRQLQRS